MCDFVCIIILSCFKCSCVYLTEVKWNKHFCQNYMKKVFEHRNLKTSKRIISERSPKISKWMLFLESLSRDTFLILEQSRVSQPAGQSYSENRKTKTALLFLVPQSHRNGYFHQRQCRGCFSTMDFYMKTLISFGESSII